MRKLSISALILCLILGTAVVAMAKETTHTAKGTVSAVDPTANTLTLKGKKGDETFNLSATTKITENGKTIALADVKTGESAQVWYKENAGKNDASKVIVHAMKAKTPTKSTKPSKTR